MKPTALFLTALILAACGQKKPTGQEPVAQTPERPQVYVANYPLAYFAQRLAGPEVDVVFPAPKDQDPAFWQPTDDQIAAYQSADLIVLNGATYSKWAEKVILPQEKIVDTSEAFSDRLIVTHGHEEQGLRWHDGTSFTTWIDFQQAILQADTLCEALKRLKPESIELFAQDFDLLKKDLYALDSRMVAVGKKLAGQPVITSRPTYQYWARRYHINVQDVLWEPDEVPTDAQIEELKTLLVTHPAQWFVWESGPAKECVAKLKILGLSSVVFASCANVPAKGDFLSVMRANVASLENSVSALSEPVNR